MKDLVQRFGDFADQMESLFSTLIPFKEQTREILIAQKKEDCERLAAWYDRRIADVDEELSILREHRSCMEPEANTPPPELEQPRSLDSSDPGINDDPALVARIIAKTEAELRKEGSSL